MITQPPPATWNRPQPNRPSGPVIAETHRHRRAAMPYTPGFRIGASLPLMIFVSVFNSVMTRIARNDDLTAQPSDDQQIHLSDGAALRPRGVRVITDG